MLRFAARYGLVRFAGRRAVPALLAWDLLMLADRTRRIPVVDRTLRRGAGAARDRLTEAAATHPIGPIHFGRPRRHRRPDG
jgi:hypothetical protein